MDPSRFEILHVRLADEHGHVVLVELDHGRANEMGSDVLREWDALADALERGPARVLVTTSRRRSSKGTPIFIAGANVTERGGWTDEQVKSHVRWQRDLLARLRRAPVFHVVVVDGVALGWGTEFLLTADYRIACPEASFGLPETGLGIIPGAGGTSELWSLVGIGQALRLGMTGERIGADEAVRIGLVQEQAPDLEAGLARAHALAAMVVRRSPTAVAAFKRGVLDSVGIGPGQRTELEAAAYETCVDHGDAAVGRAGFKQILAGEPVAWPARSTK